MVIVVVVIDGLGITPREGGGDSHIKKAMLVVFPFRG